MPTWTVVVGSDWLAEGVAAVTAGLANALPTDWQLKPAKTMTQAIRFMTQHGTRSSRYRCLVDESAVPQLKLQKVPQSVLVPTPSSLVPLIDVVRRTIRRSGNQEWMAPALALAILALLLSSFTQTWIADSRVYITAWFIVLVAGSEIALAPLRLESASRPVVAESVPDR
jgi:hypothetical protein